MLKLALPLLLAALPAGALELRFEFFNVLNRTNFNLPAPDRTEVFTASGIVEDAGRLTSSRESREIQLGIKLRF